MAPAWFECVVATPKPGAVISGFCTPSRRGPTFENDAIALSVGGTVYAHVPPCAHEAHEALVAWAPTANTESPSAGEPTIVVLSRPVTTGASTPAAPSCSP